MLSRVLSTLLTGIAVLYALEFTGVVPEGKYFPTLPRLEKSGNTIGNWAEAGKWGIEWASSLTTGLSQPQGASQSFTMATPEPKVAEPARPYGKFTDRVVAKRHAERRTPNS